MLTRRRAHSRKGVTLIELLVVLVVAGVALALIATISTRQQRILSDLANTSALSGQLRDAAAILPMDLRALSPRLGDIRDARDTAIEVRATIASAVVCDTLAAALVLAPAVDGVMTLSSSMDGVSAGDTAWVFTNADTAGEWRASRIAALSTSAAGACGLQGPVLTAAERAARRTAIVLEPAPGASAIGMPIRFTRPIRYSLYRASDGSWYLGERDWNSGSGRFNTIQPLSGPFLSAVDQGLEFRYLDDSGHTLTVPVADPRAIALIQVGLRGQPQVPLRALSSGAAGPRVDSLMIAVLLRNRR